MGLQGVRHNRVTELTEAVSNFLILSFCFNICGDESVFCVLLSGRFSQLCLATHLLTFLFLRSYFLIFRSLFKSFERFSLKSLQFLFHVHNIFISLSKDANDVFCVKFSTIVFVLFRVLKNCYFVSVFIFHCKGFAH